MQPSDVDQEWLSAASPDGDPDDGGQDEHGRDRSDGWSDEVVDLVPASAEALVKLCRENRRQDGRDELEYEPNHQETGDYAQYSAEHGPDTTARGKHLLSKANESDGWTVMWPIQGQRRGAVAYSGSAPRRLS